jgi:hypothetical protein
MSGKLFAQVVALIVIWGLVFFVATRIADWRRFVNAGAYMNAVTTQADAASSGNVSDEILMANDVSELDGMTNAH